MASIEAAGRFVLGARAVHRMGYGAMQLAGPGVFGLPRERKEALAVLREAVASGVDHIDTSDFYGPHIVNQLIREALAPYPPGLVIVTKVGAARGSDGSVQPATTPPELVQSVHDNLRNLGLEVLEVVNFRVMIDQTTPGEGSIEEQFTALAELQRQGLIRHLGISHATTAQVAQARRIADVACVQNLYNLSHRADDALIDHLAAEGVAYVPYFPLGGISLLQSSVLSQVAAGLGATPMQVALAWLLHRSPNILPIPGTSSREHLRENLQAAALQLSGPACQRLDEMAQGQPRSTRRLRERQ
jgi:pyridoxine 4-dehydrogenase